MSPQTPPSVSLTAWRTVAVVALGGAALGWALYFGLDRLSLSLPVPPLLGAGAIAVVAAIVAWQAYLTRRTIRRHEPMPAMVAVARLAFGKTALLAGAALAGGYAGVTLHSLTFLEAELPRARAIGAGVTLLASVVLAFAGRRLERACEIPPPPPDEGSATPGDRAGDSDDPG